LNVGVEHQNLPLKSVQNYTSIHTHHQAVGL
jgi:hypothetical protein